MMNVELHSMPLKVASLMREFRCDWFIAGGWAIDLYLGELTRPHKDIEVAVFRKDQLALRDYFNGWHWRKVVGGELSDWREGEFLQLPVHELHCSNPQAEPQQLEVLLNESNESGWVYRRNKSITRSFAKCGLSSKAGVNFLCPEIVLLYKSKNPRPVDEQDFETVNGRLEPERKRWLRDAIAACDAGHRWLRSL